MNFLACSMATTASTAEQDAELLTHLGAVSVSFEFSDDESTWEPLPESFDLQGVVKLTALFSEENPLKQLHAQLKRQIHTPFTLHPLENKEWSKEWMQHFSPQKITESFWVVPEWKEQKSISPTVTVLKLAPGLAFGTGAHPTTQLCLSFLAEHAPKEKKVLDFGCGSGILGIAAALLGATKVTALDHDPQALLATTENALQNQVSHLLHTTATLKEGATYDLIVANILATPLIALAPLLCAALAPGGTLVLSGILKEQEQSLCTAYAPQLQFNPPLQREDWILLYAVKQG